MSDDFIHIPHTIRETTITAAAFQTAVDPNREHVNMCKHVASCVCPHHISSYLDVSCQQHLFSTQGPRPGGARTSTPCQEQREHKQQNVGASRLTEKVWMSSRLGCVEQDVALCTHTPSVNQMIGFLFYNVGLDTKDSKVAGFKRDDDVKTK